MRSIVGRFLEHSRIFYFENGGEPDMYLGSADWMPRNLYERVEVMFQSSIPLCVSDYLEKFYKAICVTPTRPDCCVLMEATAAPIRQVPPNSAATETALAHNLILLNWRRAK